ncbi:MAG: amidohydrolase family protein [Acidimicrobiia bacterium]
MYVAPYYEDDLAELKRTVGVERMLFGSDYPHAEGLADPAGFVHDLEGFSSDEIRMIMRDNPLSLVSPAA